MKKQVQKFNLFEELKARAPKNPLCAVLVDFFAHCTAEQQARVSSVRGGQLNIGILTESVFNPNTRQNAQGEGEPSRGDFGIIATGKKGACEFKTVSTKSSADDARNGTLAPYTLILFYDRKKWFLRFGKSADVKTSFKGKKEPKRVIKYQDNLEYGEPITLKDIKTFAL